MVRSLMRHSPQRFDNRHNFLLSNFSNTVTDRSVAVPSTKFGKTMSRTTNRLAFTVVATVGLMWPRSRAERYGRGRPPAISPAVPCLDGAEFRCRASAIPESLKTAASALAASEPAAGDSIVIGGFCERGDDTRLYNSALVVDSDGVVASYRKTHLWDREKLIFTPGDALPPVVKSKHGSIAVMVCYDLEFGELTRRVALDRAELIAAPVNWPLFPRPEGEHPGEVITAMSTARTNKVAIACCDRAGVERGQQWTEGTAIIDPDGWVVASAGPGRAMAVADVDLAATHDKTLTEFVDVFADRRVDLY